MIQPNLGGVNVIWKFTAAAAAKLLQSCLTLCDPIDGSPPGSPVPGILQASTLEWVAVSFSNAWKLKVKVKSLSRFRLFATPWTAAYPGSSVHGILQARVLEWVAISLLRMAPFSMPFPTHLCYSNRKPQIRSVLSQFGRTSLATSPSGPSLTVMLLYSSSNMSKKISSP